MNLVAIGDVAQSRYHHCTKFVRAAVDLFDVPVLKLCPVSVDQDRLDEVMFALTAEKIRLINKHANRKRPREGAQTPALPRARGRQPGSGIISQLKERADSDVHGTDVGAPVGAQS